jgi:hypothetical protein
LDIFAFAGRDFFMIRLTLAMGRNRSCSNLEELSEMFSDKGLPIGLIWVLFPVILGNQIYRRREDDAKAGEEREQVFFFCLKLWL